MPRSSVHYSNESIRQARTALKGSGALLEVLDDIETHLTQYQRQAIHEAHLHGEAKDGRYTIAELARKTRILRRAGFNQIQREALLRGGVAGYNSRPIELRYGLAELELDLEYRREDRLREAEIALAREVANRPAAEAIRNAREWKESYRQWQQRGEQAARNLETAASEQRRADDEVQRLMIITATAKERAAAAMTGRAQATAELAAEAAQQTRGTAQSIRARLLMGIPQGRRWTVNLFLTPLEDDERQFLQSIREELVRDPDDAAYELNRLLMRILPDSDPEPSFERISGLKGKREASRLFLGLISERMGWPELSNFLGSELLVERFSRYPAVQNLISHLVINFRVAEFCEALSGIIAEEQPVAPRRAVIRQVVQARVQAQQAAQRLSEARIRAVSAAANTERARTQAAVFNR